MPWSPLKEALRSLFAAGEPDQRNDRGQTVSSQHDERWHLDRGRNLDREFGEPERAYDRNQKHQPHRKNNRK